MRTLALCSVVTLILSTFAFADTAGQLESKPLKVEGLPGKINALLQAWSVEDKTAAAAPHLNFKLRRAELKLSGSPVENTRYFMMVDPAKAISADPTVTDRKIVQDLGIGFTVTPGLEVVAGQFKILTNAEGLDSSAALLFPERSLVSRTYGDKREPGLMIAYTGDGYKVGVMASNGQGPNADAAADTKDLSVRTDVTVAKGISVGAFGLFGDFEYNKKGRWGVNTRMALTEESTVGVEFNMGRLNSVNSYGVMADAGYFVTQEIQPVIRYELLNTDTATNTLGQQASLGVNYVLLKNTAKVQFSYSYLENMAGNLGSPKLAVGSFGHLFTLAFQMAI